MSDGSRTCFDCGQFYGEFGRFNTGLSATMWCDLGLMVPQPLGERQDPDVLKIKALFGEVCPKFDRGKRRDSIQSLIDSPNGYF